MSDWAGLGSFGLFSAPLCTLFVRRPSVWGRAIVVSQKQKFSWNVVVGGRDYADWS